MTDKWILIVDDEDGILAVLKGSLTKLGDEYHVITASDGKSALEQVKQRQFDLIVTDYRMAGMDGLTLLEQIRQIQSDARVILMTAYGSATVESEASRLKAYRYLSKPLEINTFRQVVKEATGNNQSNQSGFLVLSDADYREVIQILKKFQAEVGARYIFLTDGEGRYIAFIGTEDHIHLETVASLLGGSVATFIEAGKIIDNDDNAINLAYREAKHSCLYVVSAGHQFLLIIVIDNNPYAIRIGSVWYSARATISTLQEKFKKAEFTNQQKILGDDPEAAISGGLREILSGKDPSSTEENSNWSNNNKSEEVYQTPEEVRSTSPRLLSFSDAALLGIIPENEETKTLHANLEKEKD